MQASNKKVEKFFRLNAVNSNYVQICNELLTHEWLLACAKRHVQGQFSKELFKQFKHAMTSELDKITTEAHVTQQNLSYQKFRQEANEHAVNWYKTQIFTAMQNVENNE